MTSDYKRKIHPFFFETIYIYGWICPGLSKNHSFPAVYVKQKGYSLDVPVEDNKVLLSGDLC